MIKSLQLINREVQNFIQELEQKRQEDQAQQIGMIIHHIAEKLELAKGKFEQQQGLSEQEEIYYFKHSKCHLLALLQYYHTLQEIEINKLPFPKKKIKQYYLEELYKVKSKIKSKQFFYTYYKAQSSNLDHQFFIRIDTDIYLPIEDSILDIDKRYTTPFVALFSHIQALDMLRTYLKNKTKIHAPPEIYNSNPHKLKWTGAKSDLIEIIYALHAAHVFNNGKADLKAIAQTLEDIFDIKLGQYTRVFYDIRARKINKTKFIDELKEALLKKINDTQNSLFP